MAKTPNNMFMTGLSGTIGRQLTLTQKAGDTIAGKKRGASKIPPTSDQLVIQERFTNAIQYAQAAILDPVKKALYTASAKRNQSAFNVAVKDAFNPPEIKSITTTNYHGQPGDIIVIHVQNATKLFNVHVSIYTQAGVLVEEGNAVLPVSERDWKYTATTQNPALLDSLVRVRATDLPGNETVKESEVA
jgi:hypothetical protein